MTDRDEQHLRNILSAAAPQLQRPSNRVGEVATRVRRRHRRVAATTAVAAALTVGLGLTLPRLAAETAERSPDPAPVIGSAIVSPECPSAKPTPPPAPGSLGVFSVPAGAVEVTLCEVPTEGGEITPIPPRVLTGDVRPVIDALNVLPGTVTIPPDSVWGCTDVQHHIEPAFIVAYPDREPITIFSNRNCGVYYLSTGQSRLFSTTPVNIFLKLYLD